MNKKQIQTVMEIARPVITRLYGRQSLKLVAYNIISTSLYCVSCEKYIPKYIWIEVEGKVSYKLKISEGEVEIISRGILNI